MRLRRFWWKFNPLIYRKGKLLGVWRLVSKVKTVFSWTLRMHGIVYTCMHVLYGGLRLVKLWCCLVSRAILQTTTKSETRICRGGGGEGGGTMSGVPGIMYKLYATFSKASGSIQMMKQLQKLGLLRVVRIWTVYLVVLTAVSIVVADLPKTKLDKTDHD